MGRSGGKLEDRSKGEARISGHLLDSSGGCKECSYIPPVPNRRKQKWRLMGPWSRHLTFLTPNIHPPPPAPFLLLLWVACPEWLHLHLGSFMLLWTPPPSVVPAFAHSGNPSCALIRPTSPIIASCPGVSKLFKETDSKSFRLYGPTGKTKDIL